MKKSILACLLVLALLASGLSGCAVSEKDPSESTDTTPAASDTTTTEPDGSVPDMSPDIAELAEAFDSFEGLEGMLGDIEEMTGTLPELDVSSFQGGITADITVDGFGDAKLYASEGYFGFEVPLMFEGTAVMTPEELEAILAQIDIESMLGGMLGESGLPAMDEINPEEMMAQIDELIKIIGKQIIYCLAFLPENCVQIVHNEDISTELTVSITASDVAAMFNGFGAFMLENDSAATLAAALAPFMTEYTEEQIITEIETFAEEAKTVTAEEIGIPDVDLNAGYYNDHTYAWLEIAVGEDFYLSVSLSDGTFTSDESDYSQIRSIDVVVDYGGAEYELYAGIYTPFYAEGTVGAEFYVQFLTDGVIVFELDTGASVTVGEDIRIRPYLVLVVDGGVLNGANICIEGVITISEHTGEITYVTGAFESCELEDFYGEGYYTGVQVVPFGASFELVYDPAGTMASTFPDQSGWVSMTDLFGGSSIS